MLATHNNIIMYVVNLLCVKFTMHYRCVINASIFHLLSDYLIGGVDYGSKPTSYIPVLISAGMTRASFDVKIINDRILEGTETFTMSIDPVSLPYGVTLGSPGSTIVSILDDDSKKTIVTFLSGLCIT